MKILIDIPKAFEVDYNTDRFAEFFQRCLADMNTCCGNYEQETAEMMEKAFEKSRLYDPAFMQKEKQDYSFKRKYAQIRAEEFRRECYNRGLNCHVSVGGLDSIILYIFLKKGMQH